jgi:hypothetical protein
MPTQKKSFIRAAEIWVPQGDVLAFGDGLYGGLDAFAELSRGVTFAPGEGLPGQAWAARHPIVMTDLKSPAFRRIAAAAEAGLTSGIALPVFAGEDVRAVVVLFCGDDSDNVGAIEVWENDPETDAQIGLHDGYYGGAELFEMTSTMKRFGKGFGLPGTVWATGLPLVIRDLYRSERFLRQEEARAVGLTLGLGLPSPYDPARAWVVTFLSAFGTPIAERFEIWVPRGDGLAYDSWLSEGHQEATDPQRPAAVGPGEGLLGRVLAQGMPVASADAAADAPWLAAPGEDGRHPALAIPTLAPDGSVRAVTLLRF